MRLATLLFTLLALNCFSGIEIRKRAPQFHLIKEEVRLDIIAKQAVFKFTIQHTDENVKSATIRYSVDGIESTVQLVDYSFEVQTSKGKHKFIIYINEDYQEIYSDTLYIKPMTQKSYNVYAEEVLDQMDLYIIDKPVIYLYPQVETEMKVHVDPVGEMNFTYPAYNDGWNVTVQPDGTIDHNGNSYNYLFWEAKQIIDVKTVGSNGGFMVEKANLLAFMETKLDAAGFTAKEKADFVTFWVPRMMAFDVVYIEFIQGDECNQFAELSIVPQPDNVNRFYMSWGEYKAGLNLTPQTITKMDRSGFDVLEWGGQQLTLEEIIESL